MIVDLVLLSGIVVASLIVLASLGPPNLIRSVTLAVPAVNGLADATTQLFPPATLNPGALRMLFLFAVLALALRLGEIPRVVRGSYLFCGYLLVLFVLEPFAMDSFLLLIKVVLPFLFLPVGMRLFARSSDLPALGLAVAAGAAILAVALVIFQVFKIGESAYAEGTFYMGGANIQVAYFFTLVLLTLPLVSGSTKSRIARVFLWTVGVASLVAVVLLLRRGALVGLLGGGVVYVLLARGRSLRSLVGIGLAACVTFFVIAPSFSDIFVTRLEARMSNEVSEEARLIEIFALVESMGSAPPVTLMFGEALFNSPAFITRYRNQYWSLLPLDRGLHVDYTLILQGSGLVGLLLYLLAHFDILRGVRAVSSDPLVRQLRALSAALVTSLLLIGFSGCLDSVGFRSTLYLMLGSVAGILGSGERNATVAHDGT